MATLQAVTRNSLQELMREFPFDPMTIVSLGPGALPQPDGPYRLQIFGPPPYGATRTKNNPERSAGRPPGRAAECRF